MTEAQLSNNTRLLIAGALGIQAGSVTAGDMTFEANEVARLVSYHPREVRGEWSFQVRHARGTHDVKVPISCAMVKDEHRYVKAGDPETVVDLGVGPCNGMSEDGSAVTANNTLEWNTSELTANRHALDTFARMTLDALCRGNLTYA